MKMKKKNISALIACHILAWKMKVSQQIAFWSFQELHKKLPLCRAWGVVEEENSLQNYPSNFKDYTRVQIKCFKQMQSRHSAKATQSL